MGRSKLNRSVEEFTDDTATILRAAITTLELLVEGRVILIVGCDFAGKVWLLPNPSAPSHVVVEALGVDWSAVIPSMKEHLAG